ncbi:MAG: hypothetical protein M1830_009846, partial [Pleopsidium flavum]
MTTEGKPAQQSHRFKLDIMSSSPETNKQMQYLTKMSAETTSSQLTASIRPLLKPIFPLASFIGTLWLFTQSDIITFVIPVTAFGILGALAGPLLTTNKSPGLMEILGRLQRVLLWNWLNTLIFDLANQRLPEAIVEDALNKPSRPLPAGRITAPQTRVLLLATVPIVLAITYFLGAWEETALLFCLNWMYNDLKGGDENFIVRNLIIGLAFALYDEASLRVACGFHQAVTIPGYHWVAITSGVIFTTMHVQDMKDQE